MGMLARLGVILGLNSAEFQKGLLGADKQLQQLAATAKMWLWSQVSLLPL